MKTPRKRDTSKLPPMEYRLVHINYLKRQKCRFNPSFAGFLDLPKEFRISLTNKWHDRHPRQTLPDETLSMPKPRRKK